MSRINLCCNGIPFDYVHQNKTVMMLPNKLHEAYSQWSSLIIRCQTCTAEHNFSALSQHKMGIKIGTMPNRPLNDHKRFPQFCENVDSLNKCLSNLCPRRLNEEGSGDKDGHLQYAVNNEDASSNINATMMSMVSQALKNL